MDGLIYGRNVVLEAMDANRQVDKILYCANNSGPTGSLAKILGKAKALGIAAVQVDRKKMDTICQGGTHQGVAAYIAAYRYVELEEILAVSQKTASPHFIVICDGITDPHNLGSIIRTANAAGVHGVIIGKHGCVGMTGTVAKAAAGALERMPVCKAGNLSNVIKKLKSHGVWVYGSVCNGGTNIFKADFSGHIAIVVGGEGDGISRLVREQCDFLLTIPMHGEQESLNASVSAALLMYKGAEHRAGSLEADGS